MAEDLLADFMGSLLIVGPAVIGLLFAYWLYKKARPRRILFLVKASSTHFGRSLSAPPRGVRRRVSFRASCAFHAIRVA